MKKKIAILGSTSSIGKSLLGIVEKNRKNFKIELLTANTNFKDLISQAKKFNVKNIIVTDFKSFKKTKLICKNKKINVYQNFENLKKILPKKIDYVMSSISGIEGMSPTFKIIKYTKLIAIANKEAIICGWPLIKKELKKNKTKFIPVDSEHFSIYSLLNNNNFSNSKIIDKVYLTASGGPFLNRSLKSLKSIKKKDALKHPNWNMGNKITIDSSTMMNKVFEVIEAKKIFGLNYKDITILTHPKSYLHAIIKFKNALIKLLIHEPDMKIPIYNSLFDENNSKIKSKDLDLKNLNNLNLKKIDVKKFPLVKLLNRLNSQDTLYETVLVTINDYFVMKFLNNEIKYDYMIKSIYKYSNSKIFLKYSKIIPKNVEDIYKLKNYVSFKLSTLGV